MIRFLTWFCLLLSGGAAVAWAQAGGRKTIYSSDDLPRYTYILHASVAEILTASPQAFATITRPMRADIDAILAGYDITDQATLRTLLSAKLGTQIASGTDDSAALATIQDIRSHQDKDAARLVSGLAPQSFLEARLASKAPPGICPAGFSTIYARHLDPLPWNIVGVGQKVLKGMAQLATPSFLTGLVSPDLQPAIDTSHALTAAEAWELLGARVNLDTIAPCRTQIVAVLSDYVGRHDVQKRDIWPARDVALPPSQKLTPVPVAIWDSGFDTALFNGKLLLSKSGKPLAGPAYDVMERPTAGELMPITAGEHAGYTARIAYQNGMSDLQNGVDSQAAAAARAKIAAMSPAQVQAFFQLLDTIESYEHGTHVAGIAAAGNPAIRLTSARTTYDTKPVPTPPTDALQQRMAVSYTTTVAWFRAHRIRVVNMSWWDRPSNYEDALEKNNIGKSADERKQLARRYFIIERDSLYTALKSAPEILFVTIAGNNNSDNAFEETIPSSFNLPNLLVVGAVDQTGEQTSFTSTGQNIGVYANGFQVRSVVPGGAMVHMTGTSMAAPAVTNLAAKLLAINPNLTPTQLIALIKSTADRGETPGILRINPKAAIAAVDQRAE